MDISNLLTSFEKLKNLHRGPSFDIFTSEANRLSDKLTHVKVSNVIIDRDKTKQILIESMKFCSLLTSLSLRLEKKSNVTVNRVRQFDVVIPRLVPYVDNSDDFI